MKKNNFAGRFKALKISVIAAFIITAGIISLRAHAGGENEFSTDFVISAREETQDDSEVTEGTSEPEKIFWTGSTAVESN